MKQFFTPMWRIREIWENHADNGPFDYSEVQLTETLKEFLIYPWDFED
jgi:hypothetical protein